MLSSLLSLVMSMVLTRVLSKPDLAAYNQTNMVFTTVYPFLQLGIPSGIYYILTRNPGRERAIINEAMLCVTGSCAVFAAFLIFGGNEFLARMFKNEQVSGYLLWLIPTSLFSLVFSIAVPALVFKDRVSFNARLNVISSIIRMSLTIAAMIVFRTVLQTLQVSAVTQIAVGVVAAYLVYKYVIPDDDGHILWSSVKRLLKVSVPLGVAAMIVTLNSYLDKWIVSFMCSPEEYAVFSTGAHEVPLITAITNSVMTVILVDLTAACKDENYPQALGIIRSAAEKTSMLLMPIMLMCFALAEPLIRFLFTAEYSQAVYVFMVYLLYMPYWTIYYGPIMTAMGKPKAVLYCALAGMVCNAAISVFFVRAMGSIGASVATILTIYIVNLPLNFHVICKELKIKWTELLPLKHYGICVLLSIPGAAACYAAIMPLKNAGSFWQLAVGGMVFALITVPIFVKHFNLPWRDIINKIKAKFTH